MFSFYSQNVWNMSPSEYRNTLVRTLVSEFDADVCAFQECGPDTIRNGSKPLHKLMSDKYSEVCPEVSAGNFTPIFYKTDKFILRDGGYFLYDGFNDANSKSVTWALLEESFTGFKFIAVSTHFWWKYEKDEDFKQRLENVIQIKDICEKIFRKHNVPIILGGDLNNGKNADQGDEPYKEMLKSGFIDIRHSAEESTDIHTHHSYPVINSDGTYESGDFPVRTIDYIFTYGSPIKAVKFDIITSKEALASSDHCPLIGYFE